MNLLRVDPFRELEEISKRLNTFLARDTRRSDANDTLTAPEWAPPVDITETEAGFEITAELPGVKKEDVKVTIDQGVLTLQGERKDTRDSEGQKIHRTERSYGRFLRSFTLPDSIDRTSVQAECKDGLLHIRLDKSEKARPKAVEVKMA